MNYFKTSWRNIRKRKGFSMINAGGLALGMTSCLLLLLYVWHHWNYDKQFAGIENIYVLQNNQQGDGKIFTFLATPKVIAGAIENEVPGVKRTARVLSYTADGLISYKESGIKKEGLFADPAFFEMFDYHFISGSPAKALVQPNSIVITKDLAVNLFGKDNPMGKTVKRNDTTQLIVTGVIENIPTNTSFRFDYFLPWSIVENEQSWIKTAGWGSNFCQTFVQLQDKKYYTSANGIIKKMINKNQNSYKGEAFMFPFSKLHLWSKFENGKSVGGMIDQIRQFSILAICILLIACINFMNLSTARSEERAREVGIRKAIGSSRKSLIAQFMSESLILSLFAMITSVILLFICLPYFNRLLGIQLSAPWSQWYFWAFLIGIAALTGVVSGSYPAFYLSSFRPVKVLKGVLKSSKGALSLRKVLVVIQFGFAVFLITSTLCVYRQINFIRDKPTGFDKGGLVEIPVEGNLGMNAELFIREAKNAGAIVAGTGLSQSITQSGNNTWGFEWPGKRPDEQVLVDVLRVGDDFTTTTGVKLIEGRQFSGANPADTSSSSIIINETAARIMKLKNPVGSTIKSGGSPVTVIGVIKDFIWGSPYQKVAPMVLSYTGPGSSVIAVKLNPARNISSSVKKIEEILKSINPAYPPVIHFTDEDFEKKFENEKTLGLLANLFGGLAIIISCLGLFGLATYAAELRTKEIGIRKVLGASVKGITALLSKDFLQLVVIAIVIAVPLSWWSLGKWLENYEYHISLDWSLFVFAGVITIIVALFTVSFQAIKAALANPVKSLRSE